jgi:hypothetical protein
MMSAPERASAQQPPVWHTAGVRVLILMRSHDEVSSRETPGARA